MRSTFWCGNAERRVQQQMQGPAEASADGVIVLLHAWTSSQPVGSRLAALVAEEKSADR